jgi:ATP-binding cassette, subfamily C (CFTR/MRP), member 1
LGSARSSPSRLPRKLATLLLDLNLTSACSLFSKLIIYWLSPLLKVGFSRPLEVEGMFFKLACPFPLPQSSADLWQLPPHRLTDSMTTEFEAKLYSRYPPEERPPKLRHMPSSTNKYDRSVLRAIHAAYWKRFWIAGFLRCIAAVTPTFSAFITRAILSWLTSVHTFHTAKDADRAQVSSL